MTPCLSKAPQGVERVFLLAGLLRSFSDRSARRCMTQYHVQSVGRFRITPTLRFASIMTPAVAISTRGSGNPSFCLLILWFMSSGIFLARPTK